MFQRQSSFVPVAAFLRPLSITSDVSYYLFRQKTVTCKNDSNLLQRSIKAKFPGFQHFPCVFFSASKYNIYSTTSGHPDILLLRNTLNHNPKCRKACCKNFIPLLGCAKLNSCFKAKRLQLYPTTNLVEPLIFKT